MGDLSKDFSIREFACHCCGATTLITRLVEALQRLRDDLGRPILVLSGYRCPVHNAEVGGAKDSQHMKGQAADIRVAGMDVDALAAAALKVKGFAEGGVGRYYLQNFVHVDVREDGPARWTG